MKISTLLSILSNYVLRQARKLEYSHVFEIEYPVRPSYYYYIETTRYGKHSVRYLGPFLWSKLTDNQRDSPSLSVFINKIRKLNLADILSNNSNCCNLCSQ